MYQDHINCNCLDCLENTYVGNHTENFDFTDAKILMGKYMAYVSLNPTAIKAAKAAEAVKAAADRAKKTGAKTVTFTPTEKAAIDAHNKEAKEIQARADAIKNAGKKVLNFVGAFKWIFFAAVAVVLIAVFMRIKG